MAMLINTKKRKFDVKSVETKYRALMLVEEGKMKKADIARKFEVPSNTLSTWIKSKDKIISAYEGTQFGPAVKKMRAAFYPNVEKALDLWFKDARSQKIPINGPILQAKAELLASQMGHHDFKCSNGWLSRYKARHGYQFKAIQGESKDAPVEDAINWR
jgi:hypothetical protein